MLDAYRSGANPAVVLPVLATWLGHTEPRDTYWYLTGTAELMAAATERLRSPAAPSQPGGQACHDRARTDPARVLHDATV